jgi:predicted chitinase/LysM repeat protein
MHHAGYARHYDYAYTNRDAQAVGTIEVRDVVPGADDNHPIVQAAVLARTTNTYDANGHLTHVEGTDRRDTRDIVNDVDGRVLRKTQYTQETIQMRLAMVAHETNTLIVNGEEIGSSSDDKAIKDSFNRGYVPTGGLTGSTFYTVQAGDSLQGIAKAFWGDANLWYLIADANGSTQQVTPGAVILIPPRPNAATDNSSTFRPYDPRTAIGDTTPTAPLPQPQGHHGGCGGLGQVLIVVVAVAATVFAAGAGAVLLSGGTLATATVGQLAVAGMGALGGTFGAGLAAAAGAIGSIAGQAVAIATGNQEGFSWKQVGLSAVSAGVSGGLAGVDFTGSITGTIAFGGMGNVVARAAIGNALTQGVGVATGLQHSFSWQAVAASAVGVGVGEAVGTELGLNSPTFAGRSLGDQFGRRLVTGLTADAAAALARGGRVAMQQVGVDAFGNAIGSSLAYDSTSALPPVDNTQLPTGDLARMDGATYRGTPYGRGADGLQLAANEYVDVTSDEPITGGANLVPSTSSTTSQASRGMFAAMTQLLSQAANPLPAGANDVTSANYENELDRMDDRYVAAKSLADDYTSTSGIQLGTAARIYLAQRLQVAAAGGQPLDAEQVFDTVDDVSVRKGLLAPTQVQNVFPNLKGKPDLYTYTYAFNTHLPDYGIDTPERQAAFFGQVAQETGGLSSLVENLNYGSAEKIANTFRRVFHGDAAAAQPYVHNAAGLEAAAYPDGAGRGVLQITGATNLKTIGNEIGVDLVSNPNQLVDNKYLSVQAAAQYWTDHNINASADQWDLRAVTLKVNGAGLMGLSDRVTLSNKYLNYLLCFK